MTAARIDHVVFNDHLEEGVQMSRTSPAGFAHWARKVGKTAEELADAIHFAQ